MLKLFEVTGFKNFKDTIRFDFSDVRDYKFNQECITNTILGKAIVYGKNSVGKTNLGLAIFDIVKHLTSNNVSLGLYDYYLNANLHPEIDPECVEFRYIFSFDNDIVNYRYTKDNDQSLIFEEIRINDALLFNYNYHNNSGDLNGLKELAPTLNLSMLDVESVLKYIISNTVLSDNHPLRRMMKFVSNMLWFRNLDENRYIGYKSQSRDYFDFIFNGNNLNEFEELLHTAGVDGKLISLKFNGKQHLYFDAFTPIPFFSAASSGTKALYTFYYWYKTATDVSLMFIDEFDAYYHYELSETIVKILEKMSSTQVILTSHNTNLLSNRIMRPDCFFILTKNGLTSFANATDRELREGHNLEKLYMSGEFNDK